MTFDVDIWYAGLSWLSSKMEVKVTDQSHGHRMKLFPFRLWMHVMAWRMFGC